MLGFYASDVAAGEYGRGRTNCHMLWTTSYRHGKHKREDIVSVEEWHRSYVQLQRRDDLVAKVEDGYGASGRYSRTSYANVACTEYPRGAIRIPPGQSYIGTSSCRLRRCHRRCKYWQVGRT
jgi:hypothetical protein